jgi:hypothetical protein
MAMFLKNVNLSAFRVGSGIFSGPIPSRGLLLETNGWLVILPESAARKKKVELLGKRLNHKMWWC